LRGKGKKKAKKHVKFMYNNNFYLVMSYRDGDLGSEMPDSFDSD